MRRLALAFAFAVTATTAATAADPVDALRGAVRDVTHSPTVDWNGYYFGGQLATGTTDVDFRHAMGLVPGANPLGKANSSGSGFGGFAGYNAQWDQALLGFELNYMHGEFGANKTVAGPGNIVTFGSVDLSDILSARLRAGWTTGIFMPYAFVGASYGIADLVQTVRTGGILTTSLTQDRHSVYGFNAGGGIEMMVFGSGFVRAEFEYTRFSSPIDTSVTTGRIGAGVKF